MKTKIIIILLTCLFVIGCTQPQSCPGKFENCCVTDTACLDQINIFCGFVDEKTVKCNCKDGFSVIDPNTKKCEQLTDIIKKKEGELSKKATEVTCGLYGMNCCNGKNQCQIDSELRCNEIDIYGSKEKKCLCPPNKQWNYYTLRCEEGEKIEMQPKLMQTAGCGNYGQPPCLQSTANPKACEDGTSFSEDNPVCAPCGGENEACCIVQGNDPVLGVIYERTCSDGLQCTSKNTCVDKQDFCTIEHGIPKTENIKFCAYHGFHPTYLVKLFNYYKTNNIQIPPELSQKFEFVNYFIPLKLKEKMKYGSFTYVLSEIKKTALMPGDIGEVAIDITGPSLGCVLGLQGTENICLFKTSGETLENQKASAITKATILLQNVYEDRIILSLSTETEEYCFKETKYNDNKCVVSQCNAGNDINCCYASGRLWSKGKCITPPSDACKTKTCDLTALDGCAPKSCTELNDADICIDGGNCLIDGICYKPGQNNPNIPEGSPGEFCDPGNNKKSWTITGFPIPEKAGNCKPYLLNGHPLKKFDIVIVPDNLEKPEEDIKKIIKNIISYNKEEKGLMSRTPFYDNRKKFNFFYLTKNAEHCKDASEQVKKDWDAVIADLNSLKITVGEAEGKLKDIMTKFQCNLAAHVMTANKECPSADYIIVLSDSGAALRAFAKPDFQAYITEFKLNDPLAHSHEFGHAFASLSDEYTEDAKVKNFKPEDFAWLYNFISSSANCDISPACNKWNSYYSGCEPGCFIGKYFKPTKNSLMNDHTKADEFNPPSLRKIEERLKGAE